MNVGAVREPPLPYLGQSRNLLVYYLVLRDQGPGDRVFRSLQTKVNRG
jgi:hypothetical protein